MSRLHVIGGRSLLPGAGLVPADILIEGGRIAAIGGAGSGRTLDATSLLVLPGIVDLHGDAFERQLQPRPGVDIAAPLALAETEAQLLANGITTAFHAVTLSWEPGLRSLPAWRMWRAAMAAARPAMLCDMRIQLRWEAFNLDALDEALADIAAGAVQMLAFNDHTPSILRKLADPVAGAKYAERAGMSQAAFRAVAEAVASREAEVPAAWARIAAAARDAGLPIASHDDDTVAARESFRADGALVCEFPTEQAVAEAARAAGDAVVMGAPNVLRGKSHLGWTSAARLAEAGLCTVLCSDYFYPALVQAPFVLAGRGVMDLPSAWALVSANPAAAAGLADRGVLAPGRRADLVLVDTAGPAPRVVAAISAGRPVFMQGGMWERMQPA